MNILIIDDQILFAEGLKNLLRTNYSFIEVELFNNVDVGYTYIKDYGEPNLIILDINVDGDRGFRLFDHLNTLDVEIPVLVLSTKDSPTLSAMAIEKGALGFISKSCNTQVILEAIQTLLKGESYSVKPVYKNTEFCERVTTRQQEVLYLLSQGLLNKQIASELNISANTVKAHLHDLFKHLKVTNRTAAVKNAQKYGLI